LRNAIVIVGPTAIGKTKISIELAKEIDGEIVSADSMQIYKFMDIGTAKPDKTEMCGIKHYLIDQVYPDEEFSVARYKELALKYMDEICNNGKTPIIVGGTGLYINSLVYNIASRINNIKYAKYLFLSDTRYFMKYKTESK
jgi:tRNA dimethylallyltransferase